jgi:hypothetical protein
VADTEVGASEARLRDMQPQPQYTSWNPQSTRVLIDLYQKHKSKVGTLQLRNIKKLFELIAKEINIMCKSNVTASHSHARWRVLERGYKKYVDNKTKTGIGRKYFEYAEEMDSIFKKKRNITPVILLSTETISAPPAEPADLQEITVEQPTSILKQQTPTETPRRKQQSVLNRNRILENMRRDRQEYYKERLKIENGKNEIQKQKLAENEKTQ